MRVLSAVLAVLITTAFSLSAKDSTFTLRYSLPVGVSYTYRVTTDQVVNKTSGVRLHTAVTMEVVGHDENANAICRFRLRSDTVEDSNDEFIYRPVGSISFAGHKLYAESGHVELILDPMGNLVSNTPTDEDMNKMPEVLTQFQRTVDANVNDPEMMGDGGSYMLNLVLPAAPSNLTLVLRHEYVDTLMFNSRAIHLPTTYGDRAVTAPDNNGAVAGNRITLQDTLYRITVLDSVRVVNNRPIGYMTFRNVRNNALGSSFTSTTAIERDMNTGLINSVQEKCYRTSNNGETRHLAYLAKAELIRTESIKRSKNP